MTTCDWCGYDKLIPPEIDPPVCLACAMFGPPHRHESPIFIGGVAHWRARGIYQPGWHHQRKRTHP